MILLLCLDWWEWSERSLMLSCLGLDPKGATSTFALEAICGVRQNLSGNNANVRKTLRRIAKNPEFGWKP
jgi:hypothetical protein